VAVLQRDVAVAGLRVDGVERALAPKSRFRACDDAVRLVLTTAADRERPVLRTSAVRAPEKRSDRCRRSSATRTESRVSASAGAPTMRPAMS
jgi:hypothetical protein